MGMKTFILNVFPLLEKYKAKATIYVVNDFIGTPGYMTESELKEIISSGLVEVGAHTLDHLNLPQQSLIVKQQQIVTSKLVLENRLGIQIETFAYPYGAFDSVSVNLVKQAGYTAAVSTNPGAFQPLDRLWTLYRLRAGVLEGKGLKGI